MDFPLLEFSVFSVLSVVNKFSYDLCGKAGAF